RAAPRTTPDDTTCRSRLRDDHGAVCGEPAESVARTVEERRTRSQDGGRRLGAIGRRARLTWPTADRHLLRLSRPLAATHLNAFTWSTMESTDRDHLRRM